MNKCMATPIVYSDVKHLWNRLGFVDFVVISQNCGASCTPRTTTIHRFDGYKVTKIKQFSGRGMKVTGSGFGYWVI